MKLAGKFIATMGLLVVSISASAQLPVLGGGAQVVSFSSLSNLNGPFGSFSVSDFPVYDFAPEMLPDYPLPGLGPISGYAERGYIAFSGLYVLGYSVAGQEVDEISRPVDATGRPLAYTVVPVSEVFLENPDGLSDYFSSGGTVVYPGLSALPGVPVVNRPLN